MNILSRWWSAASQSDQALKASIALTAYSVGNLLAWAAGVHLPVMAFILLLGVSLSMTLTKQALHSLAIAACFTVFVALIISHPVADWDARSIWFFHGKRIYLDGSLYAQLTDYGHWSHNDYPTLVPSLAASVAKMLGFWNEIVPRTSVVIAMAPGFFLAAWAFRYFGLYATWLAGVIMFSQGQLLNGYMDVMVAIYFSLGLLIAAKTNQCSGDCQPSMAHLLGIAVCTVHLCFLKNEGLVLALLIGMAALPSFWPKPKLAWPWLASLLLFALLWKLPVKLAGLETDLTANDGMLARGMDRIFDEKTWNLLGDFFFRYADPHYLVFAALLVFSVLGATNRRVLLMPMAALLAYMGILLVVFLTTFHDLWWHLHTTVERLILVFNIGTLTIALWITQWWIEKNVAVPATK